MNRVPNRLHISRRAASAAGVALLLGAFCPVDNAFAVPANNVAASFVAHATGTAGAVQIESITADGRSVSLPSADDNADGTLSCALPQGDATFIVSLPRITVLDRLGFLNENGAAQGDVEVAVSNFRLPASSPKWMPVAGNGAFSGAEAFSFPMAAIEARYVRLTFHVKKAGRIAHLGLREDRAVAALAAPHQVSMGYFVARNEQQAAEARNLASLETRARVVHVSSGDRSLAPRVIDGSTSTMFRFAPGDARPTVIVQLSANEQLNRVTAVYRTHQRGRLDVYLLDDNGKNSTDLNFRRPIASAVDEKGEGEATLDFDPAGAQFVALRWTPFDPAEVGGGFDLAEIGAFGVLPMATTNPELEAPELFAKNPGVPTMTGEGGIDNSNKLGTLAAPPQIAEVSP